MKRLYHLLILCGAILVLSGCRNQVALPYYLTIVTGDKLGNNANDKLPADIQTLCAVAFENADADTGYYPEPQLKRVGAVNAVVSLTTPVEDKFAARKSNAAFMNRCIETNLKKMTLGPELVKENAGHANTTTAVQSYEKGLINTLILEYSTLTSDSVIGKRKIYKDIDELSRVIAKAVHANRSVHVVVNYNLPVGFTGSNDSMASGSDRKPPKPPMPSDLNTTTSIRPASKPTARSSYDTVYCTTNRLISKYDSQKRVALEGDILVGTWVDNEFTEGVWYDKNWRRKETVIIGRP